MVNNFLNKWTAEEEHLLRVNLEHYDWDVTKLVLPSLIQKLKNKRTERGILLKAERMVEARNKLLESKYPWTLEQRRGLYHYYLSGTATKEIHEKLLAAGFTPTMGQLEEELARIRERLETEIKKYAEERGLKVSKWLSLDTLAFFFNNSKTDSDFIRKALHERIARG